MTILTEPQRKIMKAVLDDDYRALLASKASTTVIDRLMGRHLIAWDHDRKCGRDLTPAGVRALLDAYKARWAKDGCMAYQDDLKEVEALVAAAEARQRKIAAATLAVGLAEGFDYNGDDIMAEVKTNPRAAHWCNVARVAIAAYEATK